MKRFTIAAVSAISVVAIAAATFAQQDPAPAQPPLAQPPLAQPLKGANSFTEGQAKDRAEAAGISAISPLVKDGDGVWRGTGKKGDQDVSVAVDFKGNVISSH